MKGLQLEQAERETISPAASEECPVYPLSFAPLGAHVLQNETCFHLRFLPEIDVFVRHSDLTHAGSFLLKLLRLPSYLPGKGKKHITI